MMEVVVWQLVHNFDIIFGPRRAPPFTDLLNALPQHYGTTRFNSKIGNR